MNTIEDLKTQLISMGMLFRNKYAEWPAFAIFGTKERQLIERYALSLMKPSEIASGKEPLPKEFHGFKIIESIEASFFAVANNLITEEQFKSVSQSEISKEGLFPSDGLGTFLGIPLERINTAKGALFGIVLHNTEQSPTIDTYSELNQAFDFFNNKLFGGELPKCLITMQRNKRVKGFYSEGRFVNEDGTSMDEIAMNPEYFGVQPLPVTLSTLVHEQSHLWQYKFGKPSRTGYHNHEWANKMQEVGLMPTDTGEPEGKKVGQKITHYIMDGGLFELACKELMSTNFSLSWYDRYPPMTEADFIVRATLLANSLPKSFEDMHENLRTNSNVLSFIEDPLPEQDKDGNEIPVKKKNSSNRAKYQCPTCKTNMWGAPGSLLLCGVKDCEKVAYEEIE